MSPLEAIIKVDSQLRRCWVLGRRVHHGAAGVALAAIGVALAWHDRRDRRDWF